MTKKPAEIEIDDLDLDTEIDETAAADSIAAHPTFSKTDLLSMTVASLAGKTHDELTKWYYDSIAQSQKSAETIDAGAAAKNKDSVAAKPSGTGANDMGPFPFVPIVKEDVKAIFDGQDLSEELVNKAATLFESAVNARVVLEVTKLEEAYEAKVLEDIEAIRVELTEKVDSYLNYVVEEWITENEVAIENSVEIELVREFQDRLAEVMREHYVDLPEDRLDVVAEMSDRITDLETELNDKINETIEAKKIIDSFACEKAFREVAEGLSMIDADRLQTLVETVEFEGDLDDLKKKMTIIKEANFKTAEKKDVDSGILAEETVVIVETDSNGKETVVVKTDDPQQKAYMAALSRTVK